MAETNNSWAYINGPLSGDFVVLPPSEKSLRIAAISPDGQGRAFYYEGETDRADSEIPEGHHLYIPDSFGRLVYQGRKGEKEETDGSVSE